MVLFNTALQRSGSPSHPPPVLSQRCSVPVRPHIPSPHLPEASPVMAAPHIVIQDESDDDDAYDDHRRASYDIDGNLIAHPDEANPDAHNAPTAPDDVDDLDDPREAGRTPADVLCTCANHDVRV